MPSSKDSSPSKKWIVVQLSQNGEREKNLKTLEKSVHRILRSTVEVFIPATSQKARNDVSTVFYMDGYIFVEFKSGVIYSKLNNSSNFEMVLQNSKTGYYLLDNAEIAPLQKGVRDMVVNTFEVGDTVKVLKGSFKNLTGIVSLIHDGGEQVQINLHLSSKPVLIDYPTSYLSKIE